MFPGATCSCFAVIPSHSSHPPPHPPAHVPLCQLTAFPSSPCSMSASHARSSKQRLGSECMCTCWSRPLVLKFRTKPPASLTAVIYSAGRFCCINIATAGKPAESASVTRVKAWVHVDILPLSHKTTLPLPSIHVMHESLAVLLHFLRLPELMMPSPFPQRRHGVGTPSFARVVILHELVPLLLEVIPSPVPLFFCLPTQLSVWASSPLVPITSTVPSRR